jgi:hypothetical protein
MNEPWHVKRLRELEAMGAKRRARKEDAFVKVPLWAAALVSEATRSPAVLVWVYILYCAWKAKGQSFTLPNGWLERRGVSRQSKYNIVRRLEAYGLITVEWRPRKSPLITARL